VLLTGEVGHQFERARAIGKTGVGALMDRPSEHLDETVFNHW
jgi:hypothetical protein